MTKTATARYCEHRWTHRDKSKNVICGDCGARRDDIPKVPSSTNTANDRDELAKKHGERYSLELCGDGYEMSFKAGWDAYENQYDWYDERMQARDEEVKRLKEEHAKLCIDFVIEAKRLEAENKRLREALEFECGGRCAAGINPCNARATLDALRDDKKRLMDFISRIAPSWLPEGFRAERRLFLKAGGG